MRSPPANETAFRTDPVGHPPEFHLVVGVFVRAGVERRQKHAARRAVAHDELRRQPEQVAREARRRGLHGLDLLQRHPRVLAVGHDFQHGAEQVVGVAQGRERLAVELPRDRRRDLVRAAHQAGGLGGVGPRRDGRLQAQAQVLRRVGQVLRLQPLREQPALLGLGVEQLAIGGGCRVQFRVVVLQHVDLLAGAFQVAGKHEQLEEEQAPGLVGRAHLDLLDLRGHSLTELTGPK